MVKMSTPLGDMSPAINPSGTTTTGGGMSSFAAITTNNNSSSTVFRGNISVTSIKCEDDEIGSSGSVALGTQNIPALTTVKNIIDGITATNNSGLINSSKNGGLAPTTIPGGTNPNGSVRITVPKVEDSDESESELSIIENGKINRRTNSSASKNGPRPMSWEGELSEMDDIMDTENSNSNDKKFSAEDSQMSTKEFCEVKPELVEGISIDNNINSLTYIGGNGDNGNVTNLAGPGSLLHSGLTKKFQNESVNLKYEPSSSSDVGGTNNVNSPLLNRSKTNLLPANPSPDSAIHSVYTHSSPSQSPLTSRHAPYTPSLSRNNSDASHSSCYSYSSEFSPTHSPIQGRHNNVYGNFNGNHLHHSVLYRPTVLDAGTETIPNLSGSSSTTIPKRTDETINLGENLSENSLPSAGISRQQLINSPCPICGDKISGFHYGIFSCESCKGFFKRTVQNRKNYVCVKGGPCPVTISTRKKCPACRFDKCLQKGMKLEAIREDRTRGGRSTYQCSYTLPNSMLNSLAAQEANNAQSAQRIGINGCLIKTEQSDSYNVNNSNCSNSNNGNMGSLNHRATIPRLLQEIMDVEHLWQYNEGELSRLNQTPPSTGTNTSSLPSSTCPSTSSLPSMTDAGNLASNALLASARLSNGENTNPDLIANLCTVADHRLYKIVKWCKSLPLFKHISIDDQICLLINSWCELLLFSCCFRSISTPGEIKISQGKSITLAQAKSSGLQACIERMLNLTDHLRRLRVDRYEYVAMKVIVLLQSDTSELREPVKVRESQEKALQALQAYTLAHYPDSPAKFGELLLRIPELQRTCQLGKEMLTIKSKDGEDFNLLMELLRGEH